MPKQNSVIDNSDDNDNAKQQLLEIISEYVLEMDPYYVNGWLENKEALMKVVSQLSPDQPVYLGQRPFKLVN